MGIDFYPWVLILMFASWLFSGSSNIWLTAPFIVLEPIYGRWGSFSFVGPNNVLSKWIPIWFIEEGPNLVGNVSLSIWISSTGSRPLSLSCVACRSISYLFTVYSHYNYSNLLTLNSTRTYNLIIIITIQYANASPW